MGIIIDKGTDCKEPTIILNSGREGNPCHVKHKKAMRFVGLIRSIKKSIANLAGRFAKTGGEDASELSLILEHIPMGLYWKDANLTYRGGNAQFGRLSGVSQKDLIGKTDMEINTKEAAAIFMEEDMEFLSGKRTAPYFNDKFVPMKDGSEIWARTYKIPIYDDDAQIKYIMGLVQNVTKIKQDEIALTESAGRLRAILNSASDHIVFVDPMGKILTTNGSFVSEFVPKEVEATGKYLHEFLIPQAFKKIQENIQLSAETGEPIHFDILTSETRAGKYYEVSVCPVITQDVIVGTAIFAQDRTRRKKAEDALVKRSEQLQAAMAEAEKANKAKSEFLSRMSHEIRTPLGAIIGMAKIAGATDDLGKIKDCLEKIDGSSKHLLDIINNVLDMSKIEAEEFVFFNEVFRFENMMMDVSNLVTILVSEKKQNFEIILDKNLPEYFYADELRLRQVITNLLSNAIKFTPQYGTIRLNITNLGIVENVADIEITVSDTGIGITPEQQSRLFKPFEQAEGGIARKYGGTGLGLVICKKIVETMGGQIRIESTPNAGSRFIFNVKLQVHNADKKEPVRTIGFSDMRALIVDDSPSTREYLYHILTGFGIRCEVVEDGSEAVKRVNETKDGDEAFNVFFIDWSMPGMDGIETTKNIKSAINENSVVIMISITEWDKIEKQAKEAGVTQFIPKPLFPSTVLTILDEIAGTATKYDIAIDEKGIPDLTGYKILLAEDIAINREIATALLSPANVEIEFAENGKEAVDKFNANKSGYDLILMDIHMPLMDGYEATRLIRANNDEKSLSIPIVAMTADAFKEDIDKCRAVGMNDHIAKPIDDKELFKKILLCQPSFHKSKINHWMRPLPGGSAAKEIEGPYINEKEALKRLGGNKGIFIKLLKQFKDDGTFQGLKESIAAGHMENSRLATHSIKGMAANLSLGALYSEAVKIEAMLKDGPIDLSDLQDFEKAMDKTIGAIVDFLGKEN